MLRRPVQLPVILRDPRLRSVLLIALLAGTVEGMVVPFLALIAEERGVPLGTIGVMAAAFLLAQVALQVPFGVLSDRLGRSWIIITGLGLLCLACIGFSLADSSPVWILLRIVQGFAIAALLPSLRALVADVSSIDQRGEAFAGFNAAFFGGIFGGPLIGGFIIQLAGSRTLFLTASVGAVVLGVLVWRSFPEFRRPIVTDHVVHDAPIASGRRALAVLLASPLVGAYLLGAAIQVPGGLATAIWSIYVSDLGGSDIIVGITYSTFSIPLLVLASVAGRSASRRPRWRLLLVTSLLLSVFVAGYGLTDSILVLLIIGVCEGIVVAFAAPAIDAYMTTIADPRMMGRVQGVFATSATAGAAAVGWLSAVLYKLDHAYPFVFSGVLVVLMVIPAVILVRRAEVTAARVVVPPAVSTVG